MKTFNEVLSEEFQKLLIYDSNLIFGKITEYPLLLLTSGKEFIVTFVHEKVSSNTDFDLNVPNPIPGG